MFAEPITFYLVRHGEAENNVRGVLNSLPEHETYALTERGREQAARAAEFLAAAGAEAIFSSPIRRARETAEIIAEASGLGVGFDERLCEAEFGIFNGHHKDEFFAKYSDPASRISPDTEDGVESFIDIRGRLKGFLDEVKEGYSGKKVVIVSHGDTLEQLRGILTDESPGRSATGWYPEKGSCTEVVWTF